MEEVEDQLEEGSTTSLFRVYAVDTVRSHVEARGPITRSTTAELRERLNRLKAGMAS